MLLTVHSVFPSLGKGIANPKKLECNKGNVIKVKVIPSTSFVKSIPYSPPLPFPIKKLVYNLNKIYESYQYNEPQCYHPPAA